MTKLYEVPRNTWVKTEEGLTVFFGHIDGMYSYCTDKDKQVIHLAAWTEVKIIEDKHV